MSPIDILNGYGKKITDALRENLKEKDRYASGSLYGSIIAMPVKVYGQKIELIINMNEYWRWVDEGRKKGSKQPPPQAMIKHVAVRGERYNNTLTKMQTEYKNKKGLTVKRKKKLTRLQANKQLAFLIGRGIKKKGIKPTYFATEVFESSLIDNLKKDLAKAVGREIKLDLIKIINQ